MKGGAFTGGGVQTSKNNIFVFWANIAGGTIKIDLSRSSLVHPYVYNASVNAPGAFTKGRDLSRSTKTSV